NRHALHPHQCFRGERINYHPRWVDRRSKAKELHRYALSLAHSPCWRAFSWHSKFQAATGADHSYVSAGDPDQAGCLSAAPKMGEYQHTFWPRTGSVRVPGLPKNGRRETIGLTTTRYSYCERFVINSTCYETDSSHFNSRPWRNHRASRRV